MDLTAQGADDLDHLAVGHGEFAHGTVEVDGHIGEPARQCLRCRIAQGGAADDAEAAGFGAEEDVLRPRQRWNEAAFLTDMGDPAQERVAGGGEVQFFAADCDAARRGREAAAEDGDEGGFARAVFADQAMHLAGVERERDVVERPRAGELHRYVGKGDVHSRRPLMPFVGNRAIAARFHGWDHMKSWQFFLVTRGASM